MDILYVLFLLVTLYAHTHTHTQLQPLFTLHLQYRSQSSSKQDCVRASMAGRRSDIRGGGCMSLFLFAGRVEEEEEDSLVCHVCSHSRVELSAGPLSLLRSAPGSYPVSRRQEVS